MKKIYELAGVGWYFDTDRGKHIVRSLQDGIELETDDPYLAAAKFTDKAQLNIWRKLRAKEGNRDNEKARPQTQRIQHRAQQIS